MPSLTESSVQVKTQLGFQSLKTDCPSVIYGDTTYTQTQTHRRCLRVASSISSLGIKTGNVVSVLSPNIPAMYKLHFAVPMSGAILNNINTRLDSRTISVLLRHSESKLVFVDYELRSLILEAISLFPPNTSSPRLVLIAGDSGAPSRAAPLDDFICTYEDLVDKGDEGFEWVSPSNEWVTMTLNYTSGTTSSLKGVVHSHRGVFIIDRRFPDRLGCTCGPYRCSTLTGGATLTKWQPSVGPTSAFVSSTPK
ncbi:hypothetical protein ACFX1S_035226 [Malus domestica]